MSNKCAKCIENYDKRIRSIIDDSDFIKVQNLCILHSKIKNKDVSVFSKNLNNLISEINSSNKPTKTWNCYLFDDIEFPNDFEFSIFFKKNKFKNMKLKFNNCKIEDLYLENNKIKNILEFKDCEIKNIKLLNVEFDNTIIFDKLNIDKLDFDFVEFNEELFFLNVTINEEFDLTKTVFYKQKNFYGINAKKVKNRETARIIKDSFEQQNNIIEANKFYALEMKEREKELERDLKEDKNIFEWLVFKVHGLSSNHSQDWLLALFWIVIFTMNYSFLNFISQNNENNLVFFSLISMIVLYAVADSLNDYIDDKLVHFSIMITFTSIYYLLYGFTSKDFYLKTFSNNLNPFSIMTELSKLDFSTMIYKITIAYLIYQLIVSIRQNTRRK